MAKIKPGDLVQLKSGGGTIMTVATVGDSSGAPAAAPTHADCHWWADFSHGPSYPHSTRLPLSVLAKATPNA